LRRELESEGIEYVDEEDKLVSQITTSGQN